MSWAVPSPQPVNIAGSGLPINPTIAIQFSVVTDTVMQPDTNRTQTVIEASVLNTGDISFSPFSIEDNDRCTLPALRACAIRSHSSFPGLGGHFRQLCGITPLCAPDSSPNPPTGPVLREPGPSICCFGRMRQKVPPGCGSSPFSQCLCLFLRPSYPPAKVRTLLWSTLLPGLCEKPREFLFHLRAAARRALGLVRPVLAEGLRDGEGFGAAEATILVNGHDSLLSCGPASQPVLNNEKCRIAGSTSSSGAVRLSCADRPLRP